MLPCRSIGLKEFSQLAINCVTIGGIRAAVLHLVQT